MWMNLYFVARYRPAGEAITSNVWIPAVVIGWRLYGISDAVFSVCQGKTNGRL
jgi:hypothetical protein